jgi:hypothetical protein
VLFGVIDPVGGILIINGGCALNLGNIGIVEGRIDWRSVGRMKIEVRKGRQESGHGGRQVVESIPGVDVMLRTVVKLERAKNHLIRVWRGKEIMVFELGRLDIGGGHWVGGKEGVGNGSRHRALGKGAPRNATF